MLHTFPSALSPLASWTRIATLICLVLLLVPRPATGDGSHGGRTQATIRVRAQVISLSGGQAVRQATAEMAAAIAELEMAGAMVDTEGVATEAATGTATPIERYVASGLVRVSIPAVAQVAHSAGGGGAPQSHAILVEFIGN